MEEIKVGDRVLAKKFFGSTFTAEVVAIKRGIFGKKYLCEWTVRDLDFGVRYRECNYLRKRHILEVR